MSYTNRLDTHEHTFLSQHTEKHVVIQTSPYNTQKLSTSTTIAKTVTVEEKNKQIFSRSKKITSPWSSSVGPPDPLSGECFPEYKNLKSP